MRDFWDSLPAYLKNKYLISFCAFAVWMFFFDQNDVMSQFKLNNQLEQIEDDKLYFIKEIRRTEEDMNELITNDAKLEKFAREKYHMKKNNEVIFVFVEK